MEIPVQPGEKRETGIIDGTPDKRLYWSIISDYDIKTALCELIDNSIDRWWPHSEERALRVEIVLDHERQLIEVLDDAGGVSDSDLRYLVAPGGSNNSPDGDTIGVFGVGSKRAAVALAENISIKTRKDGERSYQIDLSKEWMEADGWEVPLYEIAPIQEMSTQVYLSALRRPLSKTVVSEFSEHASYVYGKFLKHQNLQILVNGTAVAPRHLDNWAFPPDHSPQRTTFRVVLYNEGEVDVRITCGLITDRDPSSDNYGVNLFCNKRLVCRHVKSREVGYFGKEVGVPHPDASLARVVIEIDGPARLMPWNSSKTGINYNHPIFSEIAAPLIQLLAHFSSLSRRLKADWNGAVLAYREGEITEVDNAAVVEGKRVRLPALPRVTLSRIEKAVEQNKRTIDAQPWTLGLVEAFAAADMLTRQHLATKNRIALILLDSNFEIALKEFIVHRPDLFPARQFSDSQLATLFQNRTSVLDAVCTKVVIDDELIRRAKHYYMARNKLIHERATMNVTDPDIRNYRAVIRQILVILFGLQLD